MLPSFLENLHVWLPGYLRSRRPAARRTTGPVKVWFTIADHYEPYWRKADHTTAMGRVQQWVDAWPRIASRHTDSAGRPPQYTFFYPEEEYHPSAMSALADMTARGIADVEVHLHHDGDREDEFMDRMSRFLEILHVRHGLLREHAGKLAFGFIHGNWALDNSRPDGRWCGLNNELTLLKELGCYADFTLPSAPRPTQTAIVNTIYWATDDPVRPKSHNHGTPLRPGGRVAGDLLMVPGPLGMNFRGSGRLLPRLETGELAAYDPPVAGRARSWLNLAPRVGNNIFIKLFTHGTQEANAAMLLGGGLDTCFEDLRRECEQRNYEFYYATAWEMWTAIEALRQETDPVATVRNAVRPAVSK